ncbi:hypothetical protein BO86DRAFT_407881 [Aspergillus japonicus CBS 114.51]|uniref:Leucine rich repeat protein n=1 Tax=Aspergillus japonicus CBS 114.51 TaxID=1448312 RepID=A0A8T8X8V2_ASPJA|nr:hypothetical protein BO86DRAFT_407881 [Aspergillus japonicus CBS 114.51]RAH84440.1 hypothetical protein BO86DRAFT_407881 [Aspergillus japonicus CBS 114.51]
MACLLWNRHHALHASATVSCNAIDDGKHDTEPACAPLNLPDILSVASRLPVNTNHHESEHVLTAAHPARFICEIRAPKMGKLNYLARRISGLKAGQAVSKDLKKRFPPGAGSKSAARDPFVEIDVTGKVLTDEGLAQFIGDLVDCLEFRDQEHPMGLAKVTELHLSGNRLTVDSLPMLTEVVKRSAGDLRELDLSTNDIQITTPDAVRKWANFLNSFQKCFVLRKLDLGGNALGRAGIEHLARIYMKSDLDFLEGDAHEVLALDSEDEEHSSTPESMTEGMARLKVIAGKENESTARKKKSPSLPKPEQKNAHTYAELKKYACTRGLRSIPYLILTDVSMTSHSAIQLIPMLDLQRAPESLLGFLPVVGKAVVLPESAASCKSIIWRPNDKLAPHVLRMIEVAEALQQLRESKVETELETADQSDDNNFAEASDTSSETSQDLDSATQQKLQSKLRTEFTRVCKRVRLEVIRADGVHSSTIWSTALRMMLVARALLLEDRDRPIECEDNDILERMPIPRPTEGPVVSFPMDPDSDDSSSGEPTYYHVENAAPFHIRIAQPVTSAPLTSFLPVRRNNPSISETSAVNATGQHSRSASSGPFHPSAISFDSQFPNLPSAAPGPPLALRIPSGDLSDTNQTRRAPLPSQPAATATRRRNIRDSGKQEWRYDLPFNIWRRIIAEAVGADGTLDLEQQTRIMHYASDWDVVAYGVQIKGTELHQQLWKFLESVGCFTYSPL